MLAEVLDVANLEPDLLGLNEQLRNRNEFPVGEDVASAKSPPLGLGDHGTGADAVAHTSADRLQHAPSELAINRQQGTAEMFDHPSAGDLVEPARVLNLPEVAVLDPTAAFEPGIANPRSGELRLRLAQRHA